MKKLGYFITAIVCFICCCSFVVTKDDLLGKWSFAYIINAESGQQMSVKELTMGFADGMKMEFKADSTYLEHKIREKGSRISTSGGIWKIEKDGSVLNLKTNQKWQPANILAYTGDTIIMQMNPMMNAVLVREK